MPIELCFPGGRLKCVTLSYDDGWEQDMRLCALMRRYEVAGTFNLSPGLYGADGSVFSPKLKDYRIMTRQMCQDLYSSSPLFEVASHGMNHLRGDLLSPPEAAREILDNRQSLEEQYGGLCLGHAYPYGKYNDTLRGILHACGIAYARTTDASYQFRLPDDWLRWNPTCRHGSVRLMELMDKFLSAEEGTPLRLFYLWGHSFEFDRDGQWNVIEGFLKRISGRPEIWYATNIQIVAYVHAFQSLRLSADGMEAYNPTTQDVWVRRCNSEGAVKIPAGQSLRLSGIGL